MDSESFLKNADGVLNYLVDYFKSLPSKPVSPTVEPNFLIDVLPKSAPEEAEPFEQILDDFDKLIIPGITHWAHPHFHAYFPTGHAPEAILSSMLIDGMGTLGFSWIASPACHELEAIVLDWYAKMMGLPEKYLHSSENGKGGGVFQNSASESVFVAILAARFRTIKELKKSNLFIEEGLLLPKLVAYCSTEAHSSVEKAAMMAFVKLRILEPDNDMRLSVSTLEKAINEDKDMGLIPFFMVATIGSTSCTSCDHIDEIGPFCEKENIWLHIDGAYGGAALIVPELRFLLNGAEHSMSFCTNPHKWLLVPSELSCFYCADKFVLTEAFRLDPIYLKDSKSMSIMDIRHWGIPLSRRFRALRFWIHLRSYGIEKLQAYIRLHINLCKLFCDLICEDDRFQVCNIVHFGLVCFQFKNSNILTERLISSVNDSGKMFVVPAKLKEKFVIRYCVCQEHNTEEDIRDSWAVFLQYADIILKDEEQQKMSWANAESKSSSEEEEENEEEPKSYVTFKPRIFTRMSSQLIFTDDTIGARNTIADNEDRDDDFSPYD